MMTPIVNTWQGAGLVLVVMGGLLAALREVQRRFSPDPELLRKLFHIGMGLFTLALPWLFASSWPVAALTGLTLALMIGLRRSAALKERFGRVMGGVGRYSLGEIYFPVSVALLFYLTRENLVLYMVPILILTLADSTAALIGVRYGTKRYQGIEGSKSAEGSAAFFIVTFLSVHVPLLLWTEVGRAESLLIGVIMGLLVMLFEAIAWRGLDNLFIPLAAYLLLRRFVDLSSGQLLARLVFTLLLAGAVFLYRRRTTLNDNALLGAILVGYICWWLGGWQWIIPPALFLLGYTLFASRAEPGSRTHNVHAVISICSAGLIWLALLSVFGQPVFLLPYTAAFATHLAIAGIVRLKCNHRQMKTRNILLICIGKGWLMFTLIYFAFAAIHAGGPVDLLAGLIGVAAAALVFYALQPGMEDCPGDARRWWRQACAGMLGSIIAAAAVFTR